MKNKKLILFLICFLSLPLYVSQAQEYRVEIPKENEKKTIKIANGDSFTFYKLDEGFGIRSITNEKGSYKINNKDLTTSLFIVNVDKKKSSYLLTIEDTKENKFHKIEVIYGKERPSATNTANNNKDIITEIQKQDFEGQISLLKTKCTPFDGLEIILDEKEEIAREVLQQADQLEKTLNKYINKIENESDEEVKELYDELQNQKKAVSVAKMQLSLLLVNPEDRSFIIAEFDDIYAEAVGLLKDTSLLIQAEKALDAGSGAWKIAFKRINKKLEKQILLTKEQINSISNNEQQSKLLSNCKKNCSTDFSTIQILLKNKRESLLTQLKQRERNLNELYLQTSTIKAPWLSLVLIILGIGILIIGIYYYLSAYKKHQDKKKKEKQRKEELRNSNTVRKRVTTYMKYPSGLDEVKELAGIDYYEIDIEKEFFQDSTIGKVYFHKKCIEEIYTFLSDMLKDHNKLKEGGCYLLGRWELIDEQYHVSFEQIVMPGDDAVYKEYELNFGAKIGIRMGTILSSLREKTNKQYVFTAWLHTHPGLGIFLSAQDISVQNQLADSVYKNRLTAIVIDVLTPDINFVIFTSKRNNTMNNQSDIKKEMSFEELYLWTKGNHQKTNTPPPIEYKDYYNILADWEESNKLSIELNNESIIDIERSIAVEDDFSGFFNGFIVEEDGLKKVFVSGLNLNNQTNSINSDDILGCLLVEQDFNVEKIRLLLDKLTKKPLFVLVYQPQSDNIICFSLNNADENSLNKSYTISYSELKKWTRRKR